MALTLRHYPLASGVFNLTHLNENLADITAKFDAGIDDSDISPDAAISLSKLAASNIEHWVTLKYHFAQGNAGAGATWTSLAVSATVPLDAVPIPGQSTDTSWVVTDYVFVCNDVGTADGAFGLYVGHYDGAGAWTNDHTIVASQNITPSPVDNLGTQGRSARLSSPTITYGSDVKSLALMVAAQGTAVITAENSFLAVSVRLRRVLQSI